MTKILGDDDLIFCDQCGTYLPPDEFDDTFCEAGDEANICRECVEFLEQEEDDIGGEA